MSRTKFVFSTLVALAVLATSTVAYSAFMNGGPSSDPFVVGGGRITPPSTTGFDIGFRDFSIDAHVGDNRRIYGILRYGKNTNALESTRLGDVRCVRIQGNLAVVGGTTRDSNPVEGWVIFLVDNGAPGGLTDQASYLDVEPLDPSLQTPGFPGWPRGFPNNCPSPTSGPGAGFLNLGEGDIIVSAGSH